MTIVVFLLSLLPTLAFATEARDPVKCGKVLVGRVKAANQREQPSQVAIPRGCERVRVTSPYYFEVSEDSLQTLYEGRQPIGTFGFREDVSQAVLPAGGGELRMLLRDGRTDEWKRAGFEE